MNSNNDKCKTWFKQCILFFITVAFATSIATFLLHKHADDKMPARKTLHQRNTRESKTSKEEKKRVEYHAMVAEKLYADNIREYLK